MAHTDEDYLTSKEAACFIGLSRSWLEKRRVFGDGPPYYKIGPRRVLYRRAELIAWLEQHRTRATSSVTKLHGPITPSGSD
ncbi:putative DNA-binding transcriptional regulator AlpA [Roseovarius sp. MBR-51]